MKHSIAIWLFVVGLVPLPSLAQKVRLINSTQQSWSGGIAGRYGTNYTFTVEFSDFKREPIPDTLWLGEEPRLIILNDGTEQGNTVRTSSRKRVKFEIHAGTSHDEYLDRYPFNGGHKAVTDQPHPPISYEGVALLSYTYKGRKRYFVINKILTSYPPVNYP